MPTDFTFTNHGSVWTIRAVSEEAKIFASENLAVESWMGNAHHFTTDRRPASILVDQLIAEGYEVRSA